MPDPRQLPRWKTLAFSLAPLILIVLAGEVAARLVNGPFRLGHFRELRLDMARRGYPVQKDPLLGFVPSPTDTTRDNLWRTRVTIDADGFRRNGPGASALNRTTASQGHWSIMAFGDSYTFGDQVSDDETWPAALESILLAPVLNGGVFGYSLGQTVLRAEQTLQQKTADWLIVSFIPDDISRCEYSGRYGPKPYFDIVGGRLVLNRPDMAPARSSEDERALRFKNLLGHSALLDAILSNVARSWWYKNERYRRVHPPGMGLDISRLLVDRLDDLCRQKGSRILLVAQGRESSEAASDLLRHAESRGVPTLDLISEIQRLKEKDPEILERYFFAGNGHMTPSGNRWVAEQIAGVLRRQDSALRLETSTLTLHPAPPPP